MRGNRRRHKRRQNEHHRREHRLILLLAAGHRAMVGAGAIVVTVGLRRNLSVMMLRDIAEAGGAAVQRMGRPSRASQWCV
jgi:hypothetical protein